MANKKSKTNKSTARKPSARVQQKRLQTRREILAAAQRLLHEQGADGVTLVSVAAEIGVTKQALYHYFSSKDALLRALVTTLLDDEIEALIAAVSAEHKADRLLGVLIRAFYEHYVDRIDAFRYIYCQSQLRARTNITLDPQTLRDEINPRTRHLFDVLELRLGAAGASKSERKRARQLAFTAWTSALGLLTMLSIAKATDDPLLHSDQELLTTLAGVFERAAQELR